MLDTALVRLMAVHFPWLFTGHALHRVALHAAEAGALPAAETLFARAAARHVMDLEVELLARLRVHQAITRVRATREPQRLAAMLVELQARFSRLEWIESPVAPFELVPASHLMACWLDHRSGLEPTGSTGFPLREAS